MQASRIKQLAQIAWGLPDYLRRSMTLEQAINDTRKRMDNREINFLNLAKRLIYENQNSPYRKLLRWAGCDYRDLEESVRIRGIEKTLEKLRNEEVYITLEEFKSKVPISRRGLTIETHENDFDNSFLTYKGIQGSTSGSRSRGTSVIYNWDFITEGATSDLILYEIHGVSKAPFALWSPVFPGMIGVLNFLRNIKFRRPPEKWFSHIEARVFQPTLEHYLAIKYILWCCRLFGLTIPRPEFTDIQNAYKVAKWMAETKKYKGISVVRTYTSSAVRIVKSALENGIDISGNIIFTSGDALNEKRYSFIESAGVKIFPCYASMETGLIGASCSNRIYPDDMHVYLDRLAIIQRHRRTTIGNYEVNTFLFTSLSPNTGKVLLNTEIGDFGRLMVKPCSCLFGRLGMNVRISEVRSYDKLTGEGMTLLGSELDNIIGELIVNAGGSPDDYQFWETEDGNGLGKLIIAVSPEIREFDETRFIASILDMLRNRDPGGNMISQFWKDAEAVEVVRAYPELTGGFKMLPIIKNPKQRIKN